MWRLTGQHLDLSGIENNRLAAQREIIPVSFYRIAAPDEWLSEVMLGLADEYQCSDPELLASLKVEVFFTRLERHYRLALGFRLDREMALHLVRERAVRV